ncbi:MAG: prepilin-type N-terminal cleavage/methylation domain-containing protein [Burkholderiales bacterium]|nr:prepilin-type N-terminal cleavage/methylation domain-containing protein [Burkholderiales bacterium]
MKGRRAGFTLIEVLVALAIMAVLAALAWQGLAGVIRGRDAGRELIDRTALLQTVLTQWEQDLQAIYDTGAVPPIGFDGQTLRLTRRSDAGVVLVAWAVRDGLWQRWTSAALTRSGDLQEAWLRSQQLLGNEPGQLTVMRGVGLWQIYFNRGGAWTNAQSTGDLLQPQVQVQAVAPPASSASSAATGASQAGDGSGTVTVQNEGGAASQPTPAPVAAIVAPPRYALPDGVRLQITLDGQQLTRDIALGPSGP